MSTDRTEIIAKIRKLRAMTVANGCTEPEAAVAATKLAQLMADHNISETETNLRYSAATCTTDAFMDINTRYGEWTECGATIGRLFHTKFWTKRTQEDVLDLGFTSTVVYGKFFGFPQDVAASVAMCELIYTAMNSAESQPRKTTRTIVHSFRLGMAHRFNERLQEMMPQAQRSYSSNALVVVKDDLVRNQFKTWAASAGMHFRSRPGSKTNYDQTAYTNGRAAANKVDLGSTKVASTTRSLSHG